MTQSVIKADIHTLLLQLCKIRFHTTQNPAVILINDPAPGNGHNIIKAASLMHSQRKRSVLDFVPKGKFHLIPVSKTHRTLLYPLKLPWPLPVQYTVQQFFDLLFLDLQLFLIRQ